MEKNFKKEVWMYHRGIINEYPTEKAKKEEEKKEEKKDDTIEFRCIIKGKKFGSIIIIVREGKIKIINLKIISL